MTADGFYLFRIAEILNCSLKTISTEKFPKALSCKTNGDEIFLCFGFGESEEKKCKRTREITGPFTQISDSHYSHMYTEIAVDKSKAYFSKGQDKHVSETILTVAGGGSRINPRSAKTETFDLQSNTGWAVQGDYFHSIAWNVVVKMKSFFYCFGGEDRWANDYRLVIRLSMELPASCQSLLKIT